MDIEDFSFVIMMYLITVALTILITWLSFDLLGLKAGVEMLLVILIILTVINGLAMIVNFEIVHRIVVLIMMEAKEKIAMEMKETMEKQRCGEQSA
jgi:hypothetical protein